VVPHASIVLSCFDDEEHVLASDDGSTDQTLTVRSRPGT